MSDLERAGVSIDRSFNTTSTQVNGVTVSSKTTTRFTLGLPREARIKASFSKEGLVKKLVKLFKKELQTGDAAFDDAVYVSTDTPDLTATFLTDPSIRAIIAELVQHGGVEVDGAKMACELEGELDGEPAELVRLVKAVLG
jgi:hypothetical protein